VQLPATGWVRKIGLLFSATYTTSASAAVVAGDAPWNLITGVTLTDATGQPVYQPISGYNLYLLNKYVPAGGEYDNTQTPFGNQQIGPSSLSPRRRRPVPRRSGLNFRSSRTRRRVTAVSRTSTRMRRCSSRLITR
jgi:hypothetical protein